MLKAFDNHTFAPFYGRYLEYIESYDLTKELMESFEALEAVLAQVTEEKSQYRYEEGKWSIREVLGHMMDTELVFAYRALRVARETDANIEGFDQDLYVTNSNYHNLSFLDLLTQSKALRLFTTGMAMSMSETEKQKVGMANGAAVDAAILFYIIAGHTRHHCKVIEEKYLA